MTTTNETVKLVIKATALTYVIVAVINWNIVWPLVVGDWHPVMRSVLIAVFALMVAVLNLLETNWSDFE